MTEARAQQLCEEPTCGRLGDHDGDHSPQPVAPDDFTVQLGDGSLVYCVDCDAPAVASCSMAHHRARIWKTYRPEQEVPRPTPPLTSDAILAELADEREHQRSIGWTPEDDDRHTVADWVWKLQQRTTSMLAPALKAKDYRRMLLEVAAISVAALEAHDRELG